MPSFIVINKQSKYLNKCANTIVVRTIQSWFLASREIIEKFPQLRRPPNQENIPSPTNHNDQRVQPARFQFDLKAVIYLLIVVAALTTLLWLIVYRNQVILVEKHLSMHEELIQRKIDELGKKMGPCIKKYPKLDLENELDSIKKLVSKMADVSLHRDR